MQNKILIYPKFKKIDKKEIEDLTDFEDISNHYANQFYESMKNHGIVDDPKYFQDLVFLKELMKAILMRNQNRYHSLQDWMDDAYIPEIENQGL